MLASTCNATDVPAVPAPAPVKLTRPTVSLTERGANLLTLLRVREALPGGWPWLEGELDRRIALQFADAGAD